MIERGKFRSLTLINWNGFFARTFDLDERSRRCLAVTGRVIHHHGGLGYGADPRLTLLHSRNTTEPGERGSRDKGLHGELKASAVVRYSIPLTRAISGWWWVSLQQVARRVVKSISNRSRFRDCRLRSSRHGWSSNA
ncbi:hypothetical protein ACLK17_05770 [Escherichia coli]